MTTSCATVVVPVYRAELTTDEQFSLAQTHRVLAGHPRIAVGPQWLFDQQPPWLAAFTGCESFDASFFESRAGYNALMLTPAFYERFLSREYLLICQTDALPFSDQLDHWCAQGYDYIGAPWVMDLSTRLFPALTARRLQRRARRYQKVDKRNEDGHARNSTFLFEVGNGGFSLRRVQKMIELLTAHATLVQSMIENACHQQTHAYNEDVFFGVRARNEGSQVKLPDYRTAAQFALEDGLPWARRLLDCALPFGCHAWPKNRLHWQRLMADLPAAPLIFASAEDC